MARDTTGLSWRGGGAPPPRGGGFVGSIGLNEPVAPALAVDPDAQAPRAARPEVPAGPQLTVEPMTPRSDDDRVRPSGRIRMPVG